MRSHVWMAVGLAAGLALGLVAAATQQPLLLALAGTWLRPVGTLFLNLLSMVVIPLVAAQAPSGARFIVDLVPANPLRAAVDGNLLPLIVFVTIFAVAAAALPDDKRLALTELADVATQALIRIVRWVLLIAPVGIFALVAGAVAQFGWSLVKAMAVYVLAVILGLAIFIAGVYLPAIG